MPHEIFDFVYKIRIFPKLNPDFKWGVPLDKPAVTARGGRFVNRPYSFHRAGTVPLTQEGGFKLYASLRYGREDQGPPLPIVNGGGITTDEDSIYVDV